MPALDLYLAPGSSSMAAHIALQEAGADFRAHALALGNIDTATPAFRALNPEGKVPLLLIDGRPLHEVAAILYWVARAYPAARLLPDDIEAQAHAISWMGFLAGTVHPARRAGPEEAAAIWQRTETRLGHNAWALGDYSVVDIHLFRLFWRFRAGTPEAASLPKLSAHHDRMMARPAVQRTLAAEAGMGTGLPR